MKAILFLLFLAKVSIGNAEQDFFVPKEIVNSWGYRIVDINGTPFIKRIEQMPVAHYGPGYYPRFYLERTCHVSNEEALNEQKEYLDALSKSPERFKSKAHITVFVVGSCIYSVEAGAQMFYIEYQSDVVEKLKKYISKERDHNKLSKFTPLQTEQLRGTALSGRPLARR